ncbi:hypothetical protein [Laspinema palackyanum]|uniref:hypothetical protein n=1 Tax=Laspinema palackyanum TaxID=3231601 RepID=UPI00345DCE5E|nr:hypothetical protein [Laspinema sp. D2c]
MEKLAPLWMRQDFAIPPLLPDFIRTRCHNLKSFALSRHPHRTDPDPKQKAPICESFLRGDWSTNHQSDRSKKSTNLVAVVGFEHKLKALLSTEMKSLQSRQDNAFVG